MVATNHTAYFIVRMRNLLHARHQCPSGFTAGITDYKKYMKLQLIATHWSV